MNKDGMLPTSEAIVFESNHVLEDRHKKESALERLHGIIAQIKLQHPELWDKFLPPDRENDD